MEAATYLIKAMHDRQDHIASALWNLLEQHEWNIEQLLEYLNCSTTALERLALMARPRLGADWNDDIEIIAISLHIDHAALRAILIESETPASREFGA
jgi:hypothetical protein